MVKMPHWPNLLGHKIIDLGLDRIKSILTALGNPEKKLPPIIHVAGTNGKGSTSAFLKSIFQEAGYKVHCYTSPHLIYFNERINILGTPIEDNFLYEICEECRIACEKIDVAPTFFEGTTAAAFLSFSKVKADVIILEVGLGGKLDATNVISNPAMSIITSISLDHTEYLGDNLKLIAGEKAGIIKERCPVVISQQYQEAMETLLSAAEDKQSEIFAFEYDWLVEKINDVSFLYKSPNIELELPNPALLGDHQFINAGNAITALVNLKEFSISKEAIAAGLRKVYWPARMQKLSQGYLMSKIPKDWEIWVDGAHNDAAAYCLSNWLQNEPIKPTYMIFGMTKGRDCQKFLSNFKGMIKHIVGITIENEPSSYSGEYIANQANLIGFSSSYDDDIDNSIDKIINMEQSQARIIVTGSLYLAGDVLYKNQSFIRSS